MSNDSKEGIVKRTPIPDLNLGIDRILKLEGRGRIISFKGITRGGNVFLATRPKEQVDPNDESSRHYIYRPFFGEKGLIDPGVLGVLEVTSPPTGLGKLYLIDPKTYNPNWAVGFNIELFTPPQDELSLRRFRNELREDFPRPIMETGNRIITFNGDLETEINVACGTLEVVTLRHAYGNGKDLVNVVPILQLPTP